jgi:transglutaminase-like putative cysteine protease
LREQAPALLIAPAEISGTFSELSPLKDKLVCLEIGASEMLIEYGYNIEIELLQPSAIILAMDVHCSERQKIVRESQLKVSQDVIIEPFIDRNGNMLRRLEALPGLLSVQLSGIFTCGGEADVVNHSADLWPVARLPPEVLPFLRGSRYCETDLLSDFAWEKFGLIQGGWARVQAICDFVHQHVTFSYAAACPTRSAQQVLNERVGVCRDFTHLAIALCRCLNIPARYCNGYLGDIGVPPDPAPMDFNAWLEVFLEGRWYTFDARHNVPRIGRILIARGRDAVDVPMIVSFGRHNLHRFSVVTEQIEDRAVAA